MDCLVLGGLELPDCLWGEKKEKKSPAHSVLVEGHHVCCFNWEYACCVLLNIKSAQKFWNILETIDFWNYLEIRCIVLYTIAKHVLFAFQCYLNCNHSHFRVEILPYGGGRVI